MTGTFYISQVRFQATESGDRETGLMGFISLLLNGGIRIDGITLRKTRAGHLALSFPARSDAEGRMHPVVHPINNATRIEIERQVLNALPGAIGEDE